MGWREDAKRRAALKAVEHVKDGSVVGLGSGSTVAYFIEELGRLVRGGFHVLGVPTSYQALELAVRNGVPLTTLHEHPRLDLAVDGADQVDGELNLIKGLGGALAREKVVDSSADQLVIVADETKFSERLGVGVPVPVEVLPFALPTVLRKLKEMGYEATVRESGGGKVGPVVTDNGNLIVDVEAGAIEEPKRLDEQLRGIPGVVETGLFIDMADVVYLGGPTEVRRLVRKPR